jgi:sigma-B regulation protein RsbU (phosphoserine phosphatase)
VLRISKEELTTFLPASGPPLGILTGVDWTDEEAVVRPGETLLLYTDGIVEARTLDGEEAEGREHGEYGLEGLEGVVREQIGSTPQALIEAVLDDVDSYCSPLAPHDDCTMIALKYHGHD